MSLFTNFFKASDTQPGVFYPNHLFTWPRHRNNLAASPLLIYVTLGQTFGSEQILSN
jgi:hypothetical protein